MSKWWISWEEPGEDSRPLTVPSPEYWETGFGWNADESPYATVVAIVEAPTEDDAKALIETQWKPRSWRFCEAVEADWRPPADRFPPRKEALA